MGRIFGWILLDTLDVLMVGTREEYYVGLSLGLTLGSPLKYPNPVLIGIILGMFLGNTLGYLFDSIWHIH